MASEIRLPTLHQELVHASALSETMTQAILDFVRPYATSIPGERPAMRDLYLGPNAGVVEASGRLRGYVAIVVGTAPAAGLVSSALGTGTSWLRVVSKEGRRIEDDDLERAFDPQGAKYTTPGMRVSVVTGVLYPERVHYIVVAGNDTAAASALAAKVKSTRASVDELLSGPLADAYTDVMKRSYEARLKTADEFLRAHDLAIVDSVPAANVYTNFLVHSAALSEAAQSSRAAAKNEYLVYSDMADPTSAHSGVMIYRGPIAGYTLATGPMKPVKGSPSVSWTNAELGGNEMSRRPFSMLPVDTGAYLGVYTRRAPDRNKATSEVIRNVHSRRVKWSGAVRSYNPLAEVVLHAPNDTHLLDAMSRLGAPPGGAIEMQPLEVVVTELPALDTRAMSLPELVALSKLATETTLPVDTHAFVRMLASWPGAAKLKLADVFASQSEETGSVAVTTATLQAIAAHAAATAPAPVAADTTNDDFVD
jgi:hypothetical protein